MPDMHKVGIIRRAVIGAVEGGATHVLMVQRIPMRIVEGYMRVVLGGNAMSIQRLSVRRYPVAAHFGQAGRCPALYRWISSPHLRQTNVPGATTSPVL